MPLVQFRNETKNVNITRRMFHPKKVEHLTAWFKEARKVIPQIPVADNIELPRGASGWWIQHADASLQYIKFTLINHNAERCHVVIDRRAASIG